MPQNQSVLRSTSPWCYQSQISLVHLANVALALVLLALALLSERKMYMRKLRGCLMAQIQLTLDVYRFCKLRPLQFNLAPIPSQIFLKFSLKHHFSEVIPSLKLRYHMKIGHPKRKRSCSNHPFSGAKMLVLGRVQRVFFSEVPAGASEFEAKNLPG